MWKLATLDFFLKNKGTPLSKDCGLESNAK